MAVLSVPVEHIALRQAERLFIGIVKCNALLHNQSVTVDVCIEKCGNGYLPYTQLEVILAVTSWVLPLFVLVGNIHLSDLRVGTSERLCGMRRQTFAARVTNLFVSYSVVLARLLGNPILFLFNHMEKLAAMRRIKKASRGDADIAVLGITLDDFSRSVQTTSSRDTDQVPARQSSEVILEFLQTNMPADRKLEFRQICGEAAKHAQNNRVSSIRRTAVAVAAYSIALFLALRTNIVQNSVAVHTPHTIALRELYYWLFSAAAFSSATGAFPTQRSAEGFLEPVISFMGADRYGLLPLGLWTGGSYACQPQRAMSWGSTARMGLALVMVAGAWAFAFVTSWFTPTRGLGCRSLMELGFTGAWVLNFFVSQILLRRWRRAEVVTFAMDTTLAVPMVVCLFAAFKGWYNSCRCWGAEWTAVIEHMIPGNIQQSEHDQTGMYYGFIGGAVGFQVLLSACVLLYYRHELSLIYGSSASTVSSDVEHSERVGDREIIAASAQDGAATDMVAESRLYEEQKSELAVSVREAIQVGIQPSQGQLRGARQRERSSGVVDVQTEE